MILTVHRRYYVEIKCQLDATDYVYCRFYCMLNMFRTILCPSSGAREYYTDDRCLWYLVLWFSSCRYDVELKVMCPVCRLLLYDDGRSKSLQNQFLEPFSLQPVIYSLRVPIRTVSGFVYNTSASGHLRLFW